MIKYRFIHKFLVIWILGWLYIGSQQVAISIDLVNAGSKNDSWPPSGFLITEHAGNKIMVKDKTVKSIEKPIIKYLNCDENFFTGVNTSFQGNTLSFNINKDPEDYGINELKVIQIPRGINALHSSDKGFNMHNLEAIKLDKNKEYHEIPIEVYEPFKNGSYYFDLYIEAYRSKSNALSCASVLLSTVTSDNLTTFKEIKPYYFDDILEPFHEKYPDVLAIGEYEYIEQFNNYQKMRLESTLLPNINEAAVALIQKDLEKIEGVRAYKWADHYFPYFEKNEVVIGLFGDVKEEDFVTLSKVLKPLTFVAPNLKISVSKNIWDVNLPIHFSPCTNLLSNEFNECGGRADGIFYGGNANWIWVNSSSTGTRRAHILVHELGHALGLNHNLCFNSVMSYSDYADGIPYFDQIDLMQLNVLYHPSFSSYSDRKFYYLKEEDLIEDFDLNKDLIDEYKDKPSNACSVQDRSLNFLIEMQQ